MGAEVDYSEGLRVRSLSFAIPFHDLRLRVILLPDCRLPMGDCQKRRRTGAFFKLGSTQECRRTATHRVRPCCVPCGNRVLRFNRNILLL